MARLNIEDEFFDDVMQLVAKMGDQDKAIGNAIRFLRFAQQKYKNGRVVTRDEFKTHGFSKHLFGIVAERVDGGIMAIRADEFFGWLRTRVISGSKGGSQKTEKKRNASIERELKRRELNDSKELSTSTHKHPQPSPSYSPSFSKKIHGEFPDNPSGVPVVQPDFFAVAGPDISISSTSNEVAKKEVTKSDGAKVWERYDQRFRRLYPNLKTPRNAKINAQCSKLVKDYGLDAALTIVDRFTDQGKKFYTIKGHDFGFCVKDAQSLYVEAHKSPAHSNKVTFDYEEDYVPNGTR